MSGGLLTIRRGGLLLGGLLGLQRTLPEARAARVAGRQLSGHGAGQGSCGRVVAGTPHEPLSPQGPPYKGRHSL
jgi:hypothetical protein